MQLPELFELVGQLQSVEPSDFGRTARRSNAAGSKCLTRLWYEPALRTTINRADLERRLLQSWIDWSYERNQFFDLDSRRSVALERTQAALLDTVQRHWVTASSLEHFAQLGQLAFIRYAERLTRIFRSLTLSEGLKGRGAEYTPDLQLQILGLANQEWREPILDLGCGIEASLVRHLRQQGLAATGLERRGGGPFVIERDWFDIKFEPASLGTIVAHLSFSLQFLHHHWQPGPRAYDYARKYMELLVSLIPGGLLCYAPGLPFIESMLDDTKYRVRSIPLPEPLATQMGSLRDIGTGQSVAYACQILRLD